ncbi:MAG: hypothetical protein AABZ78_12710 [Chloroflexota bacterium]
MTKSNLRLSIIVLTVATALIHFYLNVRAAQIMPGFILNGLGYLALLALYMKWVKMPFLEGRDSMLRWVYIGYTVVTIVAWIAIGDKSDALGYADKAIEILLVAALYFDSRQ